MGPWTQLHGWQPYDRIWYFLNFPAETELEEANEGGKGDGGEPALEAGGAVLEGAEEADGTDGGFVEPEGDVQHLEETRAGKGP